MFIFKPEKLKERRQALNLTLRDLAEKTGIDYSNLNRFENGEREPNVSGLGKLSDALSVTPNYFYEKK